MYYYLVGALKRRLILELQDSFSRHPLYRKITPFIQNKFSFKERPQFGLVVKGSSANKVQLSPDNFIGTIQSHVMLAHVGKAVHPLEWVREDLVCVKANNNVFPTAAGVYYLEVLLAPTNATEPGYYAIDPLLTVNKEAVLVFQSGIEKEIQLQQVPVAGTLRLWENDSILLVEGADYTLGAEGAITPLHNFAPNSYLTADYRYAVPSLGPLPFFWNQADSTTLPGVVLAFGKRAEAGQKVAVVVYENRVGTANAYGGKFEANFDVEAIARDTTQMEEIADLVIMYLWAQKKAKLEFEGIEVLDTSMGGEAEEVADEVGDEYYYTSSLSIQLRADWEVHVPLPLTISRATQTTKAGDTDPTAASGIQMVTDDDLFFATHPIAVDRNNDYERIS